MSSSLLVSHQTGTDGLTAIQGIGVVDAPELLLYYYSATRLRPRCRRFAAFRRTTGAACQGHRPRPTPQSRSKRSPQSPRAPPVAPSSRRSSRGAEWGARCYGFLGTTAASERVGAVRMRMGRMTTMRAVRDRQLLECSPPSASVVEQASMEAAIRGTLGLFLSPS